MLRSLTSKQRRTFGKMGKGNQAFLWFPFSNNEPELPDEVLQELDNLADKVEVDRLLEMGVMCKSQDYNDERGLGVPLSAKFVRTWRKKERNGEQMWLRRSRLVAREFNFMERRTDVFAPASSSVCQRILPALAVTNAFPKRVLGSLDIGDAYLKVPQAQPRQVHIIGDCLDEAYVILMCLPGQRDGARRWYDFFVSFLKEKYNAVPCAVQPSVVRIDDGGPLQLHVDDVLFLLDEEFLTQTFLPILKEKFKVSVHYAPREGGSFEFLKKTFLSPKTMRASPLWLKRSISIKCARLSLEWLGEQSACMIHQWLLSSLRWTQRQFSMSQREALFGL